ncbi:hypothetical protein [Terriglobus sp. TAA 43]|uniref:hypothetical protein n=1 Tax=Terriglobus sp. TAA 43 TaxID=278961 RepID=UPI0006468323|nr:hypothetical protein [Terriglobus sp. TAA 43]
MTHRRRLSLILGIIAFYLLLSLLWQDIYFADESMYLQAGVRFRLAMFVNELSFAPLYSMWYHALQTICPEPTVRYFLSWALLVIATASVPVIFGLEYSVLFASVLLALPYFSIWPYVSLFACIPLLAFAGFSLKRELTLSTVSMIACMACFLVAFSRPEFAYGVFAGACACIVFALVERTRAALAAVAVALALSAAMSYPLKHSSSARSGIAFVQHFNLRAQQRHELPDADPNTSLYAYRAFGIDVQSNGSENQVTAMDFYRANRRLFARHLFRNLIDPRTLLLLGVLLGALAWAWRTQRGSAFRPPIVFLALCSLPIFAAYIVVYPNMHYLTIIFPPLLIVGLEAWNPMAGLHLAPWKIVGCSVFMMLAFAAAKCMRSHKFPRPRPNLAMIRCMRSLDIVRPSPGATVLDPLVVPDTYFKLNKVITPAYLMPSWGQYSQYVQANRPDWILVPDSLSQQYGVTTDQITDLLATEKYTRYACPAEATLNIFVAHR